MLLEILQYCSVHGMSITFDTTVKPLQLTITVTDEVNLPDTPMNDKSSRFGTLAMENINDQKIYDYVKCLIYQMKGK